METSLDIPDIPKNQHGILCRKDRIRRDIQLHLSIMLHGHDVYVVFSSHIELADGLFRPALRDCHLKDRMLLIQLHIIKNVVCAVTDGGPGSQLFFWIHHLVRSIPQKEFGLDVPGCPGYHIARSQLL